MTAQHVVVDAVLVLFVAAFAIVAVVLCIDRGPAEHQPADHDAEILAVAQAGLDERPELADDSEATARTLDVIEYERTGCLFGPNYFTEEEIEALGALAEADGAEAAFVTPGQRDVDAFLAELFPRTKGAPKETP